MTQSWATFAGIVLLLLPLIARGGESPSYCEDFQPMASDWEEAVAKGDNVFVELRPPCQARAYYRLALDMVTENHPDDRSGHALVLDRLAQTLTGPDELSQAELLYLRSLRLRLARPGEKAEIAETLDHLGHLYYVMDQPEAGFDAHQQALAYRQKAFGEKSVQVAHSLGVIAAHHASRGNREMAIQLYRKAVDLYAPQVTTDEDRDDYGVILINLGQLLTETGATDEGQRLIDRGNGVLDEISDDGESPR